MTTLTARPKPANDALAGSVRASPAESNAAWTIGDRRTDRELVDQPLLSIRTRVPEHDAPGFVADALRDIRAYVQEHHAHPAGLPFSIGRPAGNGEVDLETGWPLDAPIAGTTRIDSGTLPHSLVRSTTDNGEE